LFLLHCLLGNPVRRGKQARKNPKGGAHGCAPFPETQDVSSGNSWPACEPHGSIVGRDAGRLSFGYFSLPSKKSDSRIARNALDFEGITEEQRSRARAPLLNPPLRIAQGRRQKAKAKAKAKARSRWMTSHSAVEEHLQLALG
jgi:hypothetical protein